MCAEAKGIKKTEDKLYVVHFPETLLTVCFHSISLIFSWFIKFQLISVKKQTANNKTAARLK